MRLGLHAALTGAMRRAGQAVVLLAVCGSAVTPAWAQTADLPRQRIDAARQMLAERYRREEADCLQRFAVTACVDDVRTRHREALAPLREQELQLDEADRQERAANRRAAIAIKQQAAALGPVPTVPVEPRIRQPAVPATPMPAPRAAVDPAGRDAKAAERVQAARLRRESARAAQDRVARRLADQTRRRRGEQTVPSAPIGASGNGR